jgi:hypothetical protein
MMAKTGAQNAVTGDEFGMDVPETLVDTPQLDEEARKAKYSKTKEFKEIRKYWEDRREFFKTYTPSGAEIRFQIPNEDIAQQWVLANNMITEIDCFLSQYSNAADALRNATQ